MSKAKFQSRTETVTLGHEYAGKVHVNERGFEVFGPTDAYVCTATSIQHARRILFEMHRDSERGLAS
jgi:hypothetical protein